MKFSPLVLIILMLSFYLCILFSDNLLNLTACSAGAGILLWTLQKYKRLLILILFTLIMWVIKIFVPVDFNISRLIWLLFITGAFRGLISLREISALPWWRFIPYSYDLLLAGQLTSGFLPYLKREMEMARNVLMLRKSSSISRVDQFHLLITALLIKIYQRKLHLNYSLLSRGYGNSTSPSLWIHPIKFTPGDLLPASLILGLISQQWLI
ncbi:MAG: hypothetical protein APR63_10330 [Desulfuromonas sp. SDB]|nr:MAG: hypothetical protein APR63_10330 [Desulfuromonas sp. SDB]